MQLDRYQLQELLESASVAAIARYEATKEPHKDRLTRREASEFIRHICTKEGLYLPKRTRDGYTNYNGAQILDNWVELNYLRGERGRAINSPITYSKADIIATVSQIKIARITNKRS